MSGSKITRFEDLIAWQKARLLARNVYVTTRAGTFAKDFGLAGQIQRAAVSVMSNIAEGFERRSRAEFQRFLDIARGSCGEVRSQLYVASDAGYVTESQFRDLLSQAEETARILRGLRDSLNTLSTTRNR